MNELTRKKIIKYLTLINLFWSKKSNKKHWAIITLFNIYIEINKNDKPKSFSLVFHKIDKNSYTRKYVHAEKTIFINLKILESRKASSEFSTLAIAKKAAIKKIPHLVSEFQILEDTSIIKNLNNSLDEIANTKNSFKSLLLKQGGLESFEESDEYGDIYADDYDDY